MNLFIKFYKWIQLCCGLYIEDTKAYCPSIDVESSYDSVSDNDVLYEEYESE